MTLARSRSEGGLVLGEFAANLKFDEIPPTVVELAKMTLLDTIGVMLAATTLEHAVVPVVNLVKEGGGREESSIIGFGGKAPCCMAAFANGALSHALDYSSSDDRGVAPGGVTIPAALAVAEKTPGTGGKELITAITAAGEVVMRIGGAITANPMDFGWVSPMLLGAFGSAVAAGKAARLGSKEMGDAIGNALHQAGGTWEMAEDPASTFRAIRNSFVNKAGVLAALLAERGVSAARNPLEGKNGLYHQYFRGQYDPSVLVSGLRTEFRYAQISFKPYPSCRATHTFIDAALTLAKKHDVAPGEIEEIKLAVGPMGEKQCNPRDQRCRPQTGIEAKFSIPYNVALAFARRRVTLIDFTAERIKDPVILDLARRVTWQVGQGTSGLDPGIVTVQLKNGNTLHEEVRSPYGSPGNPMSRGGIVEKFRDCATHSVKPLTGPEVDHIIGLIHNLEHQTDLGELMRLIS